MADGSNKSTKYNVEAAEILANEALHLPITEAAPIYEQLLAVYPTAAKFWKQYVEAQMAVNNDDATKQIFSRCLLNCLQVPLWSRHCFWPCMDGVYQPFKILTGPYSTGRDSKNDCCP